MPFKDEDNQDILKKLNSSTTDLDIKLVKDTLYIHYNRIRQDDKDYFEVNLADDIDEDDNSRHKTSIKVKSFHLRNKILFTKKTDKFGTIVVFTDGNLVKYYKHSNDKDTHPYARLIKLKSKVAYVHLSRRGIRVIYAALLKTKYNLPIKTTYLAVGDDIVREKNLPIFRKMPYKRDILRNAVFADFISLDPLLEGEPQINSPIRISIDIDGKISSHTLMKKSKRIIKKGRRWYYAPITRTRRNGYSVSIRRSFAGGLTLVRRHLEDVEKTWKFRFMESTIVSFLLYHTAHLVRYVSNKNVNIYYEKNAMNAEEGAFDVYKRCKNGHKRSNNYFIINDSSAVYEDIKNDNNVVRNFTLKSYWLLYRSNYYIATESFGHVNILRSDNKYIRRAPFTEDFIFLQHGVTYLKAHEKNSPFCKDKESEPSYIIVNSEKEKDVVSSMLNIEEERVLNLGMPVFDNIEYNHISDIDDDSITVMFTWKPYEEHMYDFTQSSYFTTIVEVYEMLKKYFSKNKIRIVAHPKVKTLLMGTELEKVIWKQSISEVLSTTKVLITDYSSVCYNVFYQGGAVVFYQPDINLYEKENGSLIPDNSEYIGFRAYDINSLEQVFKDGVKGTNIKLDKLILKKHVDNYRSINEHLDGKNVDRIHKQLEELYIV